MEQELAYSFHLGSDKNKSRLAKKVAKGNISGTTSLSNNAIQNAKGLSKVNKHNLRDYDNEKEAIEHCAHLLQAAEELEISADVYNVFVVRVTIDSLGNETRHLIYSE